MIKGILRVPDRFGTNKEMVYPDSDGQPMADNTEQFDWIVLIKLWLEWLFADVEDVFIAGNLLWYPIEGDNKTKAAPDVMAVFGRPKGPRGSYMQWEEAGIAPHVAFEILSPGNTPAEMDRKFAFYDRYGIEEYYKYDPERRQIEGWLRKDGRLQPLPHMNGWVSPRLGIRFEMAADTGLKLFGRDGGPFMSFVEVSRELRSVGRKLEETGRRMDELAKERDVAVQQRDEITRQRDEVVRRADRLAAKLRELGVDPDAATP